MKKPMLSLDFCYSGETEIITVQECISICAMVGSYNSGTTRANAMLTVLDAIIALFLKSIIADKKSPREIPTISNSENSFAQQ